MYPKKLLNITFWILLKTLFFKTGLSHGDHGVKKSFPKLILISFDGFRWDYLDLVKKHGMSTPNFDELVKRGSISGNGGIKNVFITKTYPNHYSLATGFYEESHGIVANSFFDPLFNETFILTDPSSKNQKWWDGKSGKVVEPVWVTNEKCKCGKKSGVVSWPGSDVENQRPSYLVPYNRSISLKTQVDILVDWFSEHEPINFGMLYFDEPDRKGHLYGPESKEVAEQVVELDGVLGHLMEKLKEEELLDEMNFIVTSDHGMVEQNESIYLDDHLDPEVYELYGTSPVFNLLPKKGHKDEIYTKLKTVPNLIVYKKEEIPKEYHYQENRRILDLLVTAEEGFRICKNRNVSWCQTLRAGDHGYNNSLESMHPIFISAGPAFRKDFRIKEPFETVDIYSLICHVLGVEPHDNEGDFKRISQVLPSNDQNLSENLIFLGVILMVIVIALTFIICACIQHYEFFMRRVDAGNDVFSKEGQKHLLTSEEDDELV